MASREIPSPTVISDFSSGLMDDISVAKALLPKNAVRKAINVVFDRPRGGISQRYGSTALGAIASSGNTIQGIHNYRSSNSSNHRLFEAAVGTIKYLNGATWSSSLTSLSIGKMRFLTYLDTMVFLNGVDSVQGWNGSSWTTSGGNLDVASFPITKFAAIINSRVVACGNTSNPDTAYLSSLESGGTISWTSGNKTIKVSPNDGAGSLTGLASNGRVVLFFKERGLYRYDDNELQRIGFIGTTSHESIATDDNGITYFFGQGANGVGIYATTGGRPVKISRAISKYISAIAASYYTSIAAYTDGAKIEWVVGDLTIDGTVYSNASLVYAIADKTWTIFSRSDSFRIFSQYIDTSNNITVVGGDTAGYIQTIDSGTTDNGVVIFCEVEPGPIVFTTRARIKNISEMITMTESFQGLILSMKVDDGKFLQIGSIDDRNKNFNLNNFEIFRGHEFFPKLTSVNSGTPWEFAGFEFPAGSVIDEEYRPN